MPEKDLNWWIEKIRKNEITFKKLKVKESAVESISRGADLATTGILEITDDIKANDLIYIISPQEKVISAGFSLINSKDMITEKALCFKPNLFIWKLINDKNKLDEFIKKFNINLDKLGISGTELFPITIDVINREKMPGSYKWYGYDESLCIVYYGISPELENFVSLILWPHESTNQSYISASREAYRNIFNLINEDSKHEKVIQLSGNYRLNLPNEVRPFRSEIESINKPSFVYDWLYVPYLKEVGETVLTHKSPLNFTRIFLTEPNNNIITRYTNFKTTVGKFIEKTSSIAKFRLIQTDYNAFHPIYEVSIHHSIIDKFKDISKGDLISLLIGEIIDGKPQATLMGIEKIEPIDVFSHIILFKLYNIFLEKQRLYLMTWDEFIELFNKNLKITENFCRGLGKSIGFDIDTFFEFQLSYFIKKINDNIYYIPFILSNLQDEKLKLIDECLSSKKKNIFDKYCLNNNFKILEEDKEGNLIFCDKRKSYIREGAEICKSCDFFTSNDNNQTLQKKYNLLKFLIEIKLFIYYSK